MARCVERLCLECCAMLLSVIYFASGVACVILGLFVLAADITDDLKHINIDNPFAVLSYSSFIVAGIFFVTGLFGIKVHTTKNGKLGIFYNTLVMFVSFLVLVSSFILLSIGKTELINRFGDETVRSMRDYGNNLKLTDTWNSWQSRLQCCGYNNKSDWLDNNLSIPTTCCRDIYIGCVLLAVPDTDDVHKKGCKEDFIRDIKDFFNGLFIVILSHSAVMIMVMLATLCTLCGSSKEAEIDNLSTPI